MRTLVVLNHILPNLKYQNVYMQNMLVRYCFCFTVNNLNMCQKMGLSFWYMCTYYRLMKLGVWHWYT